MGESIVWDSPGGKPAFVPLCFRCGHPRDTHNLSTDQKRRTSCTQWEPFISGLPDAAQCNCRGYQPDDPDTEQ
jgi:hypothetical protein